MTPADLLALKLRFAAVISKIGSQGGVATPADMAELQDCLDGLTNYMDELSDDQPDNEGGG